MLEELGRAQPLLDALENAGVRVWRDQTELPDNASITQEIRQGLAPKPEYQQAADDLVDRLFQSVDDVQQPGGA